MKTRTKREIAENQIRIQEKMKKLVLVFGIAMLLMSCERVEPNYVGVVMENYGKNGKSDFTTEKGRVWVASPGKEVFQVPLFEQRAKFESPLTLKSSDNVPQLVAVAMINN